MKKIELIGLSRYRFSIQNDRVVVRSLRRGVLCGEPKVRRYLLTGDDGKYKNYPEKVLRFYMKNPHLPALCNNVFKASGIRLNDDGDITNDFRQKQRRNEFKSIDDALETVFLIKSFNQGDEGPVREWMKEAGPDAAATLARNGHFAYSRLLDCIDEAEEMFMDQLKRFNVQRIMPLFAMYCKCLQTTAKKKSSRELRYNNEIKYSK